MTTKVKHVSWDRFLKVEKQAKDALNMVSVHDPDLVKAIKEIVKYLKNDSLDYKVSRVI